MRTTKKYAAVNLAGLSIFILTAFMFFVVVRGADIKSRGEEKRIADESLRRAAVTCYALEGRYPESYEYIKENYGVRIDERRFTVVYEIFAQNIMPRITLIER